MMNEDVSLSTWMVVEDEPDIYDVLLAMFEIWGIEGIAFVDGGEAVSWIEDVDKGAITSELPELALLDIRVPEIPGPEVGARLRKSGRLGQMAIVLITAHRLNRDEEDQVKQLAQADALIYKPLPPMPELRKILATIIEKRKSKTHSAKPPTLGHPPPPATEAPLGKSEGIKPDGNSPSRSDRI
ncbi:MAG: response regulator [Anaerolinea sp.]|nr:response regulator [Anaerolinea sp.]